MTMLDELPTSLRAAYELERWLPIACGINSDGAQNVYGPMPRMPRPELGDRAGAIHEVHFNSWLAEPGTWQVDAIDVLRRFKLIEPSPGVLSWEELP